MALRVVYYQPSHEPAVRAFNSRMRAANASPFPMPEIAPALNPNIRAPGIEFRHFVVADDHGEVHGGYFVCIQPFLIRGRIRPVAHYQAPLSEGIADKRFAAVGAAMLAHALEQHPLLFAMGMGGFDRPLPRMLRAMGWPILEAPFYFLILNARRFLCNIGPLRASSFRRAAADVLALSGLGGLAVRAIQGARTRSCFDRQYERHHIQSFSEWADQIWQANARQYSFSAVRSADYLRFIYPPDDSPYYGIQLTSGNAPIGWVEMLDCSFRDRSYFGQMRVAALLDGVGPAAAIPSLIHCAIDAARIHNADLLISNQMHRDWTSALKATGFWQGPSNYLLALSKDLAKLMDPLPETVPLIHFNRGDGDGRVNLTHEG